jgi:ATP-dependent helicase/nuclease subunit A
MSAAADYDRTRIHQQEASDPDASAWVIANAGSGKTHVLTQRVIRLLLAGADPAAILCLTFTKVAAAEMARRVFGTLGRWAMLPEHELRKEITAVQGGAPTAQEVQRARRLFATALETPGGLKIQTIHAFCEKLLHQFPFEANVAGQFSVLDDSAARALISQARSVVINKAAAEPESRLGRAMRHLAENATDMQIDGALDAVIAARGPIRLWMDRSAADGGLGDVDDSLSDLRRRLGLKPDETEQALCREICSASGWDCGDCSELASALATDNNCDRAAGLALLAIHAARDTPTETDRRLDFFLTSDSSGWRSRSGPHRFSRAARDERTGLKDSFVAEAERLLQLVKRLDLARAHAATEALLVVGDAILQAYHESKRQSGMLDFADLIAKTRNLLSRADASAWVLYKLDRRIEHILVDEAQDTSPDQWAIVQALAEDFFSGAGAARSGRTIFAVGDDKQSIFGFQGAAPRMLAEMRGFFETRVREAGEAFVARPLYLSFRSTREVLKAVDEVFKDDRATLITASDYVAHASHRDSEPGHVAMMPRIVRPKIEEPEDWTTPFDAPSAAETDLSRRIADEIVRLKKAPLPSGKHLRDGEILVLVRKRDAFANAMNRALRERGIATAGADRIPVATHIVVQDLLALADVMLLPQDDLQLAALLKSPLAGLSDDELTAIAVGRGRRSLWSALKAAEGEAARNAAETLRRYLAMADQVTPFRFFAIVLGPDGGRRRFRARLGGEVDDVLDAFLSQALAYEGLEAPSLQGFVRFIRANESDIKREAEDAATGVRVMTVHGAKGLEADVVFLVDTGGLVVVPAQREKLVPIGAGHHDPAFLWRRNAECAPDAQRAADAITDENTKAEYLRLLYVAMTRARDVLYVAGIRGERTPDECWYSVVERALVPPGSERDPETGELAEPFIWPQPLRAPSAVNAETEAPRSEQAELPIGCSGRRRPPPLPRAAAALTGAG